MALDKSWDVFEVATASTLYWKAVPVLLRQHDREEHLGELIVRVLSGVNRQNHNSRILRIHISSEEDLFFLHTLEVSEEEFQTLKVEQGILVDFANFPGKIITLLEKCICSKPEEPPRFQAILTTKPAESVFKIVETNDFKHLPHITLAFRPGNDPAVKQFLAFRLSEVKADCERLTSNLQQTQAERDGGAASLSATQAELSAIREAHERALLEATATAKARDADALAERTRELAQLRTQLDRERADLEAKWREQLDALTARNAELDSENRTLRNQKYDLDSKVSELSHRAGSAEGACRALEEEVARLRAAAGAAGRERAEIEAEGGEARARLRSAEEKLAAQKEMLQEQAERIRDLEASTRQLEERCADLKEAAGGAEARAREAAAEVAKGNRIIEKLTGELRTAKEKLKRKAAIIARQEEEVAAQERSAVSSQRDAAQLAAQLDLARTEAAVLKEEVEALKGKLEDSKKQLQGNEQMIRWLNQQVNEAQLAAGVSAASASRYTFRPSVPAPAPGAPSALSAGAVRPSYRSGVSPTSAGSAFPAYTPPSAGTGLAAATDPTRLLTSSFGQRLNLGTPGSASSAPFQPPPAAPVRS